MICSLGAFSQTLLLTPKKTRLHFYFLNTLKQNIPFLTQGMVSLLTVTGIDNPFGVKGCQRKKKTSPLPEK